jgi:hypothetical protein
MINYEKETFKALQKFPSNQCTALFRGIADGLVLVQRESLRMEARLVSLISTERRVDRLFLHPQKTATMWAIYWMIWPAYPFKASQPLSAKVVVSP